MPDAELSSLRSTMEDVQSRIVNRADELLAVGKEHEAHDLYEVERAIAAAVRRLSKVVDEKVKR